MQVKYKMPDGSSVFKHFRRKTDYAYFVFLVEKKGLSTKQALKKTEETIGRKYRIRESKYKINGSFVSEIISKRSKSEEEYHSNITRFYQLFRKNKKLYDKDRAIEKSLKAVLELIEKREKRLEEFLKGKDDDCMGILQSVDA